MNSLRLSGSVCVETCSAETTVPWITEDVELGLEDELGERLDALGRERGAARRRRPP